MWRLWYIPDFWLGSSRLEDIRLLSLKEFRQRLMGCLTDSWKADYKEGYTELLQQCLSIQRFPNSLITFIVFLEFPMTSEFHSFFSSEKQSLGQDQSFLVLFSSDEEVSSMGKSLLSHWPSWDPVWKLLVSVTEDFFYLVSISLLLFLFPPSGDFKEKLFKDQLGWLETMESLKRPKDWSNTIGGIL